MSHGVTLKFPLVAIDPGLGGTGWALWYGDAVCPAAWGVVRSSPNLPVHLRLQQIRERLSPILEIAEMMVIEIPEFYGSTIGRMVASRGDLVKLSLTCGFIIGCFKNENSVLVPASEWKGQIPKEVMHQRIISVTGLKLQDHECDAVGLGLWIQENRYVFAKTDSRQNRTRNKKSDNQSNR